MIEILHDPIYTRIPEFLWFLVHEVMQDFFIKNMMLGLRVRFGLCVGRSGIVSGLQKNQKMSEHDHPQFQKAGTVKPAYIILRACSGFFGPCLGKPETIFSCQRHSKNPRNLGTRGYCSGFFMSALTRPDQLLRKATRLEL